MKLRPHQQEASERILAALCAGTNRIIVKMATGTGKTPLFANLPNFLASKGRWLIVDHREELTDQAVDKLKKWNPGISVGVEMGSRRSQPSDRLVVAGVQTIGRAGSPRLTQFNPAEFDGVIIDESHHALAQSYRTILEHFRVFEDKRRLCLGVTATPNRADGKGLGDIFEKIVYDYPLLDPKGGPSGIRDGWLVNLRGVQINTTTELDDVHTLAGDFNIGELAEKVNTSASNDLIVKAWLEHGEQRQTIAYCVNVQHAKDLAETFKRYGVAAEAVWGGDPHRADKQKFHRAGTLKLLTNCELYTEGYDDWRISCIITARPTKSETLYTQIVGRGTRIQDGIGNMLEAKAAGVPILKEDCLILDVVGVTSRHSLVSLPSLFGLNAKMDLRGKFITQVLKEVEDAKKLNPFIDASKVPSLDALKIQARQIDLFRVSFAPEIIQLSQYQWHKTGENAYVLLLKNAESVTVIQDMLEHWHIVGTVNNNKLRSEYPTFEEALKTADTWVGMLYGQTSILKREAPWHNDPPSQAQLTTCKRWGIVVPPGATKGDVAKKMNIVAAERAKKNPNQAKRYYKWDKPKPAPKPTIQVEL